MRQCDTTNEMGRSSSESGGKSVREEREGEKGRERKRRDERERRDEGERRERREK